MFLTPASGEKQHNNNNFLKGDILTHAKILLFANKQIGKGDGITQANVLISYSNYCCQRLQEALITTNDYHKTYSFASSFFIVRQVEWKVKNNNRFKSVGVDRRSIDTIFV